MLHSHLSMLAHAFDLNLGSLLGAPARGDAGAGAGGGAGADGTAAAAAAADRDEASAASTRGGAQRRSVLALLLALFGGCDVQATAAPSGFAGLREALVENGYGQEGAKALPDTLARWLGAAAVPGSDVRRQARDALVALLRKERGRATECVHEAWGLARPLQSSPRNRVPLCAARTLNAVVCESHASLSLTLCQARYQKSGLSATTGGNGACNPTETTHNDRRPRSCWARSRPSTASSTWACGRRTPSADCAAATFPPG